MASTSTGMGMFNTQLPQFNGKNYEYWAITMTALFASQDLWEIVEDGFKEPADENEFNRLTPAEKDLLKSNRKKDSKSRVLLYLVVDQSVFPRLAAAKTSNEAWQTLKTAYQGMERVKTSKLQLLRKDFENLCMKESYNIDSFFTHRLSRNENSSLEQAFKTQMSFERGRGQGRGNKRGRGRSQYRGEGTVQQMLKEEAAIQIRTKAKEAANKEDNIMLKDKGMKNPMSNAIIVKNMGIMPVNVGRRSMI
eukprot:PITA_04822